MQRRIEEDGMEGFLVVSDYLTVPTVLLHCNSIRESLTEGGREPMP